MYAYAFSLCEAVKRFRMAANWQRVAVPVGRSLPSVPLMRPWPTAHCMAETAYIHIKDKGGRDDVWDFPALGKGHIDFPAIFEELKAAGNDSPLSIEIEFTPEGAGSLAAVDQAVADNAAYLTANGFEL